MIPVRPSVQTASFILDRGITDYTPWTVTPGIKFGVYAINRDGTIRWQYVSDGAIEGSAVLDTAGHLYFGTTAGTVYSLDSSGVLRWKVNLSATPGVTADTHGVYAGLALDADGTIYVTSYAGDGNSVVQAVSPGGVVEWSQPLSGYNDASIAIGADGSILVGMHNNSLYAIEEEAVLAQTAWPKFGYDPQQTHTTQWGSGDVAVLSVFPTAKVMADGWYYVDWIGLGWFRADSFPWINHWQHGWWWCGHATSDSLWVYDIHIGWVYLLPMHANLLYSHQYSAWLYHAPGSSVYDNGRWFFNYSANGGAGEWFLEALD